MATHLILLKLQNRFGSRFFRNLGATIPDASPVEVLRTLMDANDLRQKDLLPVFGSESIVSEVLHKKRDLNKTHIEKLSKRFNVSPAVFF